MLGETLQTEAAPVNLKSSKIAEKMFGSSRLPDAEIKDGENAIDWLSNPKLLRKFYQLPSGLNWLKKGTSSSPNECIVSNKKYHINTTEGLSYWLGWKVFRNLEHGEVEFPKDIP